jgi:transposase-like protein
LLLQGVDFEYKYHRFPGEIISHGVWLYYRFNLSYREVQEFLLERGIEVSHEAIRKWCGKFGQDYANRLRRRRPQPGDKAKVRDTCENRSQQSFLLLISDTLHDCPHDRRPTRPFNA